MAKPVKAPWFARWGIVLTIPLLRAGIKLAGPGNYPMYLLTVRGRKSGQLRTVPILLLEQNGKCYLAAAYGSVNWVHNLRAAGEATLTRGRCTETVAAGELPPDEAALVIQTVIKRTPFARTMTGRFYRVVANTSPEQFEQAMLAHPVFLVERKAHGSFDP